MACIGATSMITLLQGCASAHHFAMHEWTKSGLKIRKSEFAASGETKQYRNHVIVKAEKLNFPIYVSKINDIEYTALWMECTHQGAELSAQGAYLVCSAHGSEFDHLGNVTQGPAQNNLRKFNTTTDNDYIYIHLS